MTLRHRLGALEQATTGAQHVHVIQQFEDDKDDLPALYRAVGLNPGKRDLVVVLRRFRNRTEPAGPQDLIRAGK